MPPQVTLEVVDSNNAPLHPPPVSEGGEVEVFQEEWSEDEEEEDRVGVVIRAPYTLI